MENIKLTNQVTPTYLRCRREAEAKIMLCCSEMMRNSRSFQRKGVRTGSGNKLHPLPLAKIMRQSCAQGLRSSSYCRACTRLVHDPFKVKRYTSWRHKKQCGGLKSSSVNSWALIFSLLMSTGEWELNWYFFRSTLTYRRLWPTQLVQDD